MSIKEHTKFIEHHTVPMAIHGDPQFQQFSHLRANLVQILAMVVKVGSAVPSRPLCLETVEINFDLSPCPSKVCLTSLDKIRLLHFVRYCVK